MLADFTITIHEARKPLAVQVKVHENVAALRRASTIYDKRYGTKASDFSDTLGICHRFHIANHEDKEKPLCAIVRLCPEHIGIGVVSHELCHAAIWMWEIQNKFKHVPLTCSNDEWFCWVLGELVRQTTLKLIEKDIY